VVNPLKTVPIGGLPSFQGMACVMINRVGTEMPAMPTGRASETHMMLAQTTIASTDMPSGDSPWGLGRTSQIRKNRAQPTPNPESPARSFADHRCSRLFD